MKRYAKTIKRGSPKRAKFQPSSVKTRSGGRAPGRKIRFTRKKSTLTGKVTRAGNHHFLSYGASGKPGKKPFIKKLEKVLSPQISLYNKTYRIATTVGVQTVAIVNMIFSPSDVINLGSGFAKNNKVLLEKCRAKSLFTNQQNQNVFVDIYDCVFMRDYAGAHDAKYLWTQGDVDEGASGAETTYGSTPFQSGLFTAYCKVLRISRTTLAQGESHEHVTMVKPNRMWNEEINGNMGLAADQGGLKGLTHFTMLVITGAPYNDSVTATQVSSGPNALDVISTKEYRTSYVASNAFTISNNNVLPTAFTVNEDIMNEDTGAVVVGAVAA